MVLKVLLHICCGICAAGSVDRLVSEGHEVKGFFYNPNIYPLDEYKKRLDASYHVSKEMGFEMIEGPFDTDAWQQAVEGFEDEPEGGKRCDICFRYRLEGTFRYLEESGCDVFTSTLTISPHKPADVISAIGREIGGEQYLERDFKKKAGFQKANELSKQWGIYRQNYCGCTYSLKTY